MARIGIVFGDTVIMSEQSGCATVGNNTQLVLPSSAISEQELVELVRRQHVQVSQCLSAARLLLGVASGLQEMEITPENIIEQPGADLAATGVRIHNNVTPLRTNSAKVHRFGA